MAAIDTTKTGPIGTGTSIENTSGVPKDKPVGTGTVGSTGPAPDAPPTQQQPGYKAMLDSIVSMMPEMTSEEVDLFLADISAKMKDAEQSAQTDKFKADQEAKRTSLQEKQAKLEEAETKIIEAKKAAETGNIFEKIKIAFQFLAAAFMAVLGAILVAVPATQGLGALLIASAVIMTLQAIDSIVKQETGAGMTGNLFMAMGVSKEDAAILDMTFGIGLAIAGIVAAIGTAVVTGGTSLVLSITSIASSIVSATADVGSASSRYVATKTSAEGKELQAEAKEFEGNIQYLDGLVDMALKRIIDAMERFSNILDLIKDMSEHRADLLSKKSF